MDNTVYTTLGRQSGLMREMQSVANNIANLSTTGYRAEGVIFAEFVQQTDGRSLSMAKGEVRRTDLSQGPLTATGSPFDMAIEGPGFFQLETPQGLRLSRAGAFSPNDAGEMVSPDGFRLLDLGGAPIFVPPDAANLSVAQDGTVSADGQLLGQIGLVRPADPTDLTREGSAMFAVAGEVEPVGDAAAVLQGFVENSNVNAVSEVARMIEVQHAYEMGQSFLEREDERVRAVLRTLGQ